MKSTDLLSQLRFVADGMNGISLPATVRTRVYCFRSNPCVKPSPTPGVTKGWFLSGQWAPLTSMDSTPYLVTAGRFSSFVWGGGADHTSFARRLHGVESWDRSPGHRTRQSTESMAMGQGTSWNQGTLVDHTGAPLTLPAWTRADVPRRHEFSLRVDPTGPI